MALSCVVTGSVLQKVTAPSNSSSGTSLRQEGALSWA